jgi:hypothetical protein
MQYRGRSVLCLTGRVLFNCCKCLFKIVDKQDSQCVFSAWATISWEDSIDSAGLESVLTSSAQPGCRSVLQRIHHQDYRVSQDGHYGGTAFAWRDGQ